MKLIINPHFFFRYQVNVTGTSLASCDMQLSVYKYSTFKSLEGVGASHEAAVCVLDYE